jgi:LmbE family N-acetylglucosaminyl deacetylase
MQWIYLSPHFDDVALSCGGLVWEQVQSGLSVTVWTICAGGPPEGALSPFAASLHERWDASAQAASQRHLEDIASCQVIGAAHRHDAIPDCIYRRAPLGSTGEMQALYTNNTELLGEIHPSEAGLIDLLSQKILREIPSQVELVCPMAVGGHVDHRLTRAAAELVGRKLWYYLDYPYVLRYPNERENLRQAGWTALRCNLSESAMQAWQTSIAAHASQISSFWSDLESMQAAIRDYNDSLGGELLWRAP